MWSDDSGQLAGAIYLAPASTVAYRLLKQFGRIPGSSRLHAGNGDLYLFWEPNGTTVLLRGVLWNGTNVRPYLELVPSVADAWFAAMRARHEWLWAEPVREQDGTVRYDLVHDPITRYIVDVINFDPHTRVATLASTKQRFAEPDGTISESAIRALAPPTQSTP